MAYQDEVAVNIVMETAKAMRIAHTPKWRGCLASRVAVAIEVATISNIKRIWRGHPHGTIYSRLPAIRPSI